MYNAVAPLLLAASTCAPASSNFSTTREWPLEHATTKPVLPSSSALSKSDRKSTRLNSSHSSISYSVFFFFNGRPPPRAPPSSPTRRSSDLLSHNSRMAFGTRHHQTGSSILIRALQIRSEEHTSELQSQFHLVFRLFFF